LVKLFRIGSTVKGSSREKQKYDSRNAAFSHQRGAILVCTLRGHAGVITDIGVSADNALLATASEDGDVRVWGMTDGCPVAILRGHEGGANMVSFLRMKYAPF
jgi:WD40 repeat protein